MLESKVTELTSNLDISNKKLITLELESKTQQAELELELTATKLSFQDIKNQLENSQDKLFHPVLLLLQAKSVDNTEHGHTHGELTSLISPLVPDEAECSHSIQKQDIQAEM